MPDNPGKSLSREGTADLEAQIHQLQQMENRSLENVVNYLRSLKSEYPEVTRLISQTKLTDLPAALHGEFHDIPLTEVMQKYLSQAEEYRVTRMGLEAQLHNGIEEKHEKQHKKHSHQLHGVANEPKYMDHDARYRDLLEADPLVKQLRETRPDLASLSSIALLEEGAYGLNPAMIPHLTALDPTFDAFLFEEQARETFRQQFPEDAKVYDARERVRIYKNPRIDPELQRLERRITQKIVEREAKEKGITPPVNARTQTTPFQQTEFAAQTRKEELLTFTRNFLHKAQAYASQIPELASAVGVALEEQARGITLAGSALTAADAGISPASFYEDTLSSFDTGEPLMASADAEDSGEIPDLHSSEYRKPPPTSQAFSSPQPTDEPDSNDTSNGNRQGRQPRRRGRTPPRTVRPPTPTTHQIIKWARRIPWLFTPQGYITIGIIIAIIIFFILVGGIGDIKDPTTLVPVSITKTVDKTEVDNPPNTEDITYTLSVSYPGEATDILVEDPIPEGAEYISSDPPGKLLDGAEKETSDTKQVKKVTWSLRELQKTPGPSSTTALTPPSLVAGIDYTKYTRPPYNLPQPNGPSDIEYTDSIMANLNTLGNAVAKSQTYLTGKYDAKYVDPFLSVIWVGAIEGTLGDPYSWNCQDNRSITINDGCAGGYYSGGWQVGYGIQVSQAGSHLVEDFNVAYGDGSANDANKVAEVGQKVITNSASSSKGQITNPSTFPKKTISTLVSEAESGNTASQQAIAILLMDPNLGAIAIALEVAGDIASRDNWSGTMSGWGSYYSSNMQNFSNRMKAIAERYTGEGGGGGNRFTNQTLKLTVRAIKENTYLINQATARVIGGRSTPGDPDEPGVISPDGKHACPVKAKYVPFAGYEAIGNNEMSWICEHCHDSNTFRSIDMGTYPGGGTPVTALANGTATKFDDGRSIALEGDDGVLYFYTHMAERSIPDGSSEVKIGQVLGTVAAAGAPGSANNNVAHLHIQGTTNGDHFHPNIYMGPLLDSWCSVNVCQGKNQTSCGF